MIHVYLSKTQCSGRRLFERIDNQTPLTHRSRASIVKGMYHNVSLSNELRKYSMRWCDVALGSECYGLDVSGKSYDVLFF